MSEILYIIPARSLSKRVKNKNIKDLGKIPLLGHKIKACLKTKTGKVIVSTDSKKLANYAKKMGAQVPFLRPKKYSSSKATMMSCVLHLLSYYRKNSIKLPDYIATMPPTYPFLKANSIVKAFNKLKLNKKFSSLCAYTKSYDHPYSFVKNKKKLNFNLIKYEGYKLSDFERTQDYPAAFILSGAIRITRISYFLKYIKNTSPKISNYVIDFKSCLGFKLSKREAYDINDYNDFDIAEFLEKKKNIWVND